jgi:hypothetical protein
MATTERTAPANGASGAPAAVPVAYCPRCGSSLAGSDSFVQELWVASETVYHCWCRSCGFTWNLTRVERVVTHEAEH